MKVYIVLESIDLGCRVHSVWETEKQAEQVKDILTNAWRVSYPDQNWEYKYLIDDRDVRSVVFKENEEVRMSQLNATQE